MVNLNMRSVSRKQLLAAAGLATISLIGLQLTSDFDDYNVLPVEEEYDASNGLRRQLEVTVDDVPIKLDAISSSTTADSIHRQLQQQLDEADQDDMSSIQRPLLRELPTVCVSGVCLETTLAPNAAPDFEPLDYDSLGSSYNISHDDIDDNCQMSDILGPTEIPTDVEFKNTIIVGYPGADKRTVLRQMEAMTTLSGRDSWDLAFLGLTLQPFIKTNYPHHEGIYGK